MTEQMPSLRTIESEEVIFNSPPLKTDKGPFTNHKKKPLMVNHLQKQYIYSKQELHGFIESNRNLANSMLKPIGSSPLSIIEEQINRYEVAKHRKSLSSKKVTKELGPGLLLLQDSLVDLTDQLTKIEIELQKDTTAMVAPVQQIPDPSLPTLEVVDSAIEQEILDPDNLMISPEEESQEIRFNQDQEEEEEKKAEVRGFQSPRDSIILEDSDELCFSAISFVLQCINKLLQIISSLLVIPGVYPDEEREKKKLKDTKTILQKKDNYHLLKANLARLRLCLEGLQAARKSSPDQLFYLKHSHEDWQKLMQHYSFEDSANPEPYRKFYNRIALTNATMSKGMRGSNSLTKIMRTGAHLALYGFSNKKAHSQYEQFIANPDIEVSRAVWNLPDRYLVKGFFKLFLKNVKHDQVLYLPRTYPHQFTLQYVTEFAGQYTTNRVTASPSQSFSSKSELFNQKESLPPDSINPSLILKQAAISEEPMKDVIQAYGDQYLTEARHFSLQRNEKSHYLDQIGGGSYQNELSREIPQHALHKSYSYTLSKKLFDPESQVMVRLISNKPVPHDFKTGRPRKSGSSFGKTFRCCGGLFDDHKFEESSSASTIRSPSDITRSNLEKGEIIVHIHGGGFIAMSSFSHSNYLRQWAVDTNVPIFSIDYRLAPQNPYPKALDDCWQAYYWIVKHTEEMLGLPLKKVILVGDSAGGNLILGVTLKAIHSNFKVPDGLILCYPALNLSLNTFNPSHLISLEDLILPYSFLKICLELYVAEGDPDRDPFLSPILINDEDLRKFPPVRIMIAGKDPLRDDSFKFALRLLRVGVDVHLKEFRTFPHGFLSYDMPMGIKECKRGVRQGTKWIKELLDIASLESRNHQLKFTESWDEFRKSNEMGQHPRMMPKQSP